jgi:hypothetical protein
MRSAERSISRIRQARVPLGAVLLLNVCLVSTLFWRGLGKTEDESAAKAGADPALSMAAEPPRERPSQVDGAREQRSPGAKRPAPPETVGRERSDEQATGGGGAAETPPAMAVDVRDATEEPDQAEQQAQASARVRRVASTLTGVYVQAAPWRWPLRGTKKAAEWIEGLAAVSRRDAAGPSAAEDDQAQLVLFNPPETGGPVHFLVDGRPYSLAPGARSQLAGDRPRRIRFDRGEDFGEAVRELSAGDFEFRVTEKGWRLEAAASRRTR